MRRRATNICIASLTGLTVVAGLLWAAVPADARGQQRAVLTKDVPLNVTFPEFTRELPQSSTGSPNPDQCLSAEHCDTIPLRIEIPTNIGRGDDYYVELSVSWEDEYTNLDVWLWDNKQTKESQKRQPGEDGYTPDDTTNPYSKITNSTTQAHPEKMLIVEPRLVDYNLTVLNYKGGTFGGASGKYTVTGRMVVTAYTAPIESTEDDPGPTSTDFEDEEDDGFTDSSGGDPFAELGSNGSANNPFGDLGNVSFGCDPLLCGIKDQDIGSDMAAPLPVNPPLEPVVAKPPSGAMLVIWLVVVPVGLVLGGAAILRRRRLSTFVGI